MGHKHIERIPAEALDVPGGGDLVGPEVEARGPPAAIDAVPATEGPEPQAVPLPAVTSRRPEEVVLDRHEALGTGRITGLGQSAQQHVVVVVAVDEDDRHASVDGDGGDVTGERAARRPVTGLVRVITEPVEPEPKVTELHHPVDALGHRDRDDLVGPVLVTMPVAGEQQLHQPIGYPSP